MYDNVSVNKNSGLSFTACYYKGDGRPAHGKRSSNHDFAVGYVAVQCCHYQRTQCYIQLCLAFLADDFFSYRLKEEHKMNRKKWVSLPFHPLFVPG